MGKPGLSVFLAVFLLVLPSVLFSYDTHSFFLVVIDGLRNQEAYEDSTHQYIPRIWNDLKPLGTSYTNFFNMIRPATTPAHIVFLSGVRTGMMNNFRLDLDHFRSRYPTVFEHYRQEKNIPADSTWIVTGKRNLGTCDYSLHPAYGEEYGASVMGDAGFDTTAYEAAIDVIDSFHPSLMLINLKDVDRWAHSGDFDLYTTAIQIADSLVYELYNHLQNDEFYQDKVTLFITTDHGRMDDLNGGFLHHGFGTHGDRSCFFLAIGPDIKNDHIIEEKRSLIDVAPTIGELMGFAVPFAEGDVMRGMFQTGECIKSTGVTARAEKDSVSYTNLSNSPTASLYPAIAVTDSAVSVLWSEVDGSTQNENRLIRYTRSTDESETWTEPETVFENQQVDGTVYRADLRAIDENRSIATMCGYYGYNDPLGLRTYKWFVAFSTNTGTSAWDPPELLSGYTSPWRTIILNPPRAAQSGLELFLDWVVESWFVAKVSSDSGSTFDVIADYRTPGLESHEYLESPDVAADGDRAYFAAERNTLTGSEIYCLPFETDSKIKRGMVRIDKDSTISFRPSLGVGNGVLHVTWTDRIGGFKGIYHRKSSDGGTTFTEPVLLSTPGVDSWNSDISVGGDTLMVVWEDYSDGVGEIYSCTSADAGASWGFITRETETTGFSVHPRIDSLNGGFYLVWQDHSAGNWEVYLKHIAKN